MSSLASKGDKYFEGVLKWLAREAEVKLKKFNSTEWTFVSDKTLSPQQIHPKRWESIIQKRLREDDAMYNIETTDEYECPKCNK